MKIKIIIIPVIILAMVVGTYKYLTRSKEPSYDLVVAEKGSITQRVSATGQVIPIKTMDLQFEIQGTIATIKTKQGQEVEAGDALAILDTSELNTQLQEAEASRDVVQAQLNQVLAGAAPEEIKVYEVSQENAQIALQSSQTALANTQQNLADVKAIAEENLNQAYDDALDVLDDGYLKAYNASNTTVSIYRSYLDIAHLIKSDKENIEIAVSQMQTYLKEVSQSQSQAGIDQALIVFKQNLSDINDYLEHIREIIEDPQYFYKVSATDKTALDSQKSYINTSLVNIGTSQQTISSTKLTNEYNINIAKASVDNAQNQVYEAEGALKSSQEQLAKIKALPQQSDVDLARAQLEQTETVVNRVKQKLVKSQLLTPCDGTIGDLKKQEGEMVMNMMVDPVVTIICKGNFQVEVDIPEVDIAQIDIGNPAEIVLDAIPDHVFRGKVIEINPAETIIQGVVYYKVTVSFEETGEKIKPGMTANVDIITETKEDVLAIPQRAVFTKNGKKYVRILEEEKIKENEVITGIKGSLGEIEIVSGLKRGDKVITFISQK